jgi:predicted DNA-binding antitoxin AbrB/MazE fold protein
MSHTIKAIYKNGTLVLDEPLAISNGSTVNVLIVEEKQNEKSKSARSIARRLGKIANLPMEGTTEKFSGRDHDRILYGKETKK